MIHAGELKTGNTLITNVRHYESLRQTYQALEQVLTSIRENRTGDLLALDIRHALRYLGEITGEITIGHGCRIHRCDVVGNVVIGDYSSLWGPNLDVTSNGEYQVEIGKFCSIARSVSIQAFNHNYKRATTYFIGKNIFNQRWPGERTGKGNITIGNDVWIGAHSLILTGVTVNHGALIAANSVVTSDVPPYAIVAGSPAKVINYRFPPEVIDRMLELKWWDWPLEKIKANEAFFREDVSIELINSLQDA